MINQRVPQVELSVGQIKVPVECYSRIVGYYRPINHSNPGKQSEISVRKEYDANKAVKTLFKSD